MRNPAPRFEDGREMRLAGVRREHPYAKAPQEIPQQWQDFTRILPLPGQLGQISYGVIASTDEIQRTMDYLACVEVETFEGFPAGMGRLIIPAAHYVVLEHEESVTTIRTSWDWLWSEWFPHSGFRSGPSPAFERYDERFDPKRMMGGIELWLPIVSK